MRLLLATLVFLFSTPALAQSTGNDLLSDCEQLLKSMTVEGGEVGSVPSVEGGRCWGFMSAAHQFMFLYNVDTKRTFLGTCIPTEVTRSQLIRIVVHYGEQHPEKLHAAADLFVLDAVADAFPCGKD